jgi:tetratricopeptide (TPR) repeat protein
MNPPRNRLDEYGFPIPPTFDDTPDRNAVIARWKGSRWVRLGLLVMLLTGALTALLATDLGKAPRTVLAAGLAERAERARLRDDTAAALRHLNTAIWLDPEQPQLYLDRGRVRLERSDLHGSLKDINRYLQAAPTSAEGYLVRSTIWQRLKQHKQAIDDLTKAIEYLPPHEPVAWNNRAYARAIAGVDLQEALADVEKAIKLSDSEQSAYIDTRGYIHYLLGNYAAALADMEHAVWLAQREAQQMAELLVARDIDPAVARRFRRQLDEQLAVIYTHRGMVREKMGLFAEAQADLELGRELGYNPERGVF